MNAATEKEFERVLKALANKRRLAIMRLLKKRKELPVGDIASAIKLSFKATSRHLAVLFAADIVEREQRSVQMFYRIASPLPEPAGKIISSI